MAANTLDLIIYVLNLKILNKNANFPLDAKHHTLFTYVTPMFVKLYIYIP